MSRLRHEALIYSDDRELVGGLAPYVRSGLAAGEAVVAVLPERGVMLLERDLGPLAGRVRFIDAAGWYRRPSTTIAAYAGMLDELDGQPARVIGEVQFGEDPDGWAEWTRYEAALNAVFAMHDASILCPYDERALPADVIDDARRTHPLLRSGATAIANDRFADPRRVMAEVAPSFPAPTAPPDLELRIDGRPQEARRAFTAVADAAGLDDEKAAQLAVALNEVVTNAIIHGDGDARLRLWWSDTDGVIGAVTDGGSGVHDPLAGFAPPSPTALGGRGVWMARQLFDRVELEHTPDGFTVWLAARP